MKTSNKNQRQALTVETAKTLIGKRIKTFYSGYRGQDGVDNFIVGEIISELEYYRNLGEDLFINKGFSNRSEYWESYMKQEALAEKRETLIMVTADGRNTFIRAYPGNDGFFSCSDYDRFVTYEEVNDEN